MDVAVLIRVFSVFAWVLVRELHKLIISVTVTCLYIEINTRTGKHSHMHYNIGLRFFVQDFDARYP